MLQGHAQTHPRPIRKTGKRSPSPEALARREQHQSQVLSLGLTPAVIERVVDTFYERVKKHPELSELFLGPIGDRWPAHLKKMKAFWLSVALNTGSYSGKPVLAHQTLSGIAPRHFEQWLDLFGKTARDVTGADDAANYLLQKASRISNTLLKAMFPEHSRGREQDV